MALAVLTAVPSLASAQPTSGSLSYPAACTSVAPAESDRAHTLYQAGKAYYDDASYDSAITQFRESYKKDCTKHELLIIISRAHELKADRVTAVEALEEYLRRVPNSPDAQQHRTRIENLRKQLAMQPPAAPPTAAMAGSTALATVSPPVPAPSQNDAQGHTLLPWLVVGAGGAAVVTGAILLAVKPAVPVNCNESTGNCKTATGGTPEENAAQSSKEKDKAGLSVGLGLGGMVTIIAGAGLIAGGLLWHFVEPTSSGAKTSQRGAKPHLEPRVAPGYAGVSWGGVF